MERKKASVGKSVQAKKSTQRDSVTHKTEPCLSDALADAFSGRSSGDKIRSPGAVFCAYTWYTHTCSAMLGLDFVCPSCYRFLMKREEKKRHRWRQLFLFLLPQLGTIHNSGESLRHSMCYTWGDQHHLIALLHPCVLVDCKLSSYGSIIPSDRRVSSWTALFLHPSVCLYLLRLQSSLVRPANQRLQQLTCRQTSAFTAACHRR